MAEDQDLTQSQRIGLEGSRALSPSVVVEKVIGGDIAECTVAELLTAALDRIETYREANQGTPAGREFSLAITYVEEARSRWNAGGYRTLGTYGASDWQKSPAALALQPETDAPAEAAPGV